MAAAAPPEHPLKAILDNDAIPIAERVAAIAAATPEILAQQIVIPASTVMRNPFGFNSNSNSNNNNAFRRRYKSTPTQRFTVLDYALNKAVPVELVAALLDKGIAFDRHKTIPNLFTIRSNINKNRHKFRNYNILLNNNLETIRLFLERGAFANIDFKSLLSTNNDDLIMMFLKNDRYIDGEYSRARKYQNLYGNPLNYLINYGLNVPNTFIDFLKPLELNFGGRPSGVIYPPLSLFRGGRSELTQRDEIAPIDNLIEKVRFDLLKLYFENFPEEFERNKAIITKKLIESMVNERYNYSDRISQALTDLNLIDGQTQTLFNIIMDSINPINKNKAVKYIVKLGLLEKYLEENPEQFSKDIKKNRKYFIDFLFNKGQMSDREKATMYLEMLKPHLGLTDRNEMGATFLHNLARTRSPYYENVVALAGVDPTKLKNVYGMTPESAKKHYTSNILNRQINEQTERELLTYPANRRNTLRPTIRARVKKSAVGGRRRKSKRQTRRRS